MSNAVLESLRAQRAEQLTTMDAVLGQIDGRDMVDAERSLLEASRQRIAELDAQIKPLGELEALRNAEPLAGLPAAPARSVGELRRAGGPAEAPQYRSAGEVMVDVLRSQGILERGVRDEEAARRLYAARAVANQVTGDTPGILPTPIVGQVVNLIDASRPLITSLGGSKPMAGIPGATFTRPKVTQHTLVGDQTGGEKTELPSQPMKIQPVAFTKETKGGTVDVSRQDIDWTSPSAWDILVRDLADVYATMTETTAAGAVAAGATGTPVPVATADLAGWATALYTAAANSYTAGKKMPDRVWVSLDVWASLGALVDASRVVLPTSGNLDTAAGSSSLADFRGDILGLPRIVVPTFPAGTCIVGSSTLYEFYEETIGLLSVVEPSILGVQVAYGGYVAGGFLEASAFVPVTPPAGLPLLAGAPAPAPSRRNGG